jgi:hypothetical protein
MSDRALILTDKAPEYIVNSRANPPIVMTYQIVVRYVKFITTDSCTAKFVTKSGKFTLYWHRTVVN